MRLLHPECSFLFGTNVSLPRAAPGRSDLLTRRPPVCFHSPNPLTSTLLCLSTSPLSQELSPLLLLLLRLWFFHFLFFSHFRFFFEIFVFLFLFERKLYECIRRFFYSSTLCVSKEMDCYLMFTKSFFCLNKKVTNKSTRRCCGTLFLLSSKWTRV